MGRDGQDGTGWDGMGWDGIGWDGMGWDWVGLDWRGLDGMGWDGMRCDEMGQKRVGWDRLRWGGKRCAIVWASIRSASRWNLYRGSGGECRTFLFLSSFCLIDHSIALGTCAISVAPTASRA